MLPEAQICRLCLRENEDEGDDLEEPGTASMAILNNNDHLLTIILSTTSLEVAELPGQPVQYLCYECEQILQHFTEFRNDCILNDSIFRKKFLFQPLDIKSERSSPDDRNHSNDELEKGNIIDFMKSDSGIPEELQSQVGYISANDSLQMSDFLEQVTYVEVQPSHKACDEMLPMVGEGMTSDKRYQCPVCRKYFKQRSNWKKHTQSDGEKHTCDVCQQILTSRCALAIHLKEHAEKIEYKCTFCARIFHRLCQYSMHVRIHTGEKPYKCETCGRPFRTRGDVTRHYRTHSKERPYKCNQCDKAFHQSYDLKVHIRTHTGEAPFKCACCGKAFRKNGYLKAHMRTHTGEKPFTCPVCLKHFGTKSDLNRHVLSRKHKQQ